MKTVLCGILGVVIMSFISSPILAFEEFFAEDLNSRYAQTNSGEDVHRIDDFPNAKAERVRFISRLQGAVSQDFESFAPGTLSELGMFLGVAGQVTLKGGKGINYLANPATTQGGKFPTSGTKYFWTQATGTVTDSFSLEFEKDQMAFGFFATDFEKSTIEITFQSRNGDSVTRVIPYNQNCPNGSVVFYGVIDPEHPFTKVIFKNTLNEQQYLYDWFGFDDFTIQPVPTVPPVIPPNPTEPPNPPSTIPEPGTLLLFGSGLIGILALARKKLHRRR